MAADLGKVVILPVLAGVFISERGSRRTLSECARWPPFWSKGHDPDHGRLRRDPNPHLAGLGLGTIKVAVAMFLQFLLSYLIPLVLARKLPLRERIAIAFANGVRNIVGGRYRRHGPLAVAGGLAADPGPSPAKSDGSGCI